MSRHNARRPVAYSTMFGMVWKPERSKATIEFVRIASDLGGGAAVGRIVVTDHKGKKRLVDVVVSPKGESVRVYFDNEKMVAVEADDE